VTFTEEYCEKYLEKVFYFSLRKTGSERDAEELASDISYEIIAALRRGIEPNSFQAWVWKIARNRYLKWAKAKYYSPISAVQDIDELADLLPDKSDIEKDLVLSEDLSLMRRELAFIRSDYRNILVAHYFEEKSVSVIAREFDLPLGTVKTKLQNSRKQLKEGMNMAREFGKRSYKPEEISFVNSCSSFGDKGQPWSILTHALYKNIFLEVYGNPETAEELSLELGVALPYMEDELKFLTEQTFLINDGDKYETSFPIISRDAQKLIYGKNISITAEVTSLLEQLVDKFSRACEENGIYYYGKYQNYEDAKWTLLMMALDKLFWKAMRPHVKHEYAVRPDNGRWDIVGFQEANLPIPPLVGQHTCTKGGPDRPPVHFQQFKYQYENIKDKTPDFITHDEALTLKMVAQGKWEACESLYIQKLLEYGYIRKENDGYVPAIIVFSGYDTDSYLAKFSEEEKTEIIKTARKIKTLFADVSAYAQSITASDLPPIFKNDERMCNFACLNVRFDRGFVLEQALRDGWLRYDENTSRVIGAYIYI